MKSSSKPYLTLGIDIGGTNTVFGVVDDEGRILVRGKIPTTGHPTFHEFIITLYQTVKEAMANAEIDYESLVAIGVGAPCLNHETGIIEGAVNLPWTSPLPLTFELTKAFGIPAIGENDANAAALGELFYGIAKGMDNFIMLTLGTGVGSAIICDGRLLRGKRGLAGELGHTLIRRGPEARKCNCGRKGCLDAYASARGVVTTANELLEKRNTPSTLREITDLDSKAIGDAASNGDAIALETMRLTGEILGEACADFTAFSSPEAFIFFGGVANAFPLFKDAMKKSFKENLLWVYDGQVRFLPSTLKETDAAILGAAAVGRDYYNHLNTFK